VVKDARSRSARGFYVALAAVALVGVGAIAYQAARRPRAAVTMVNPDLPPPSAAEARGYLLGRADAPVQILEFADFECPACGQFATVTEPDVRARIIAPGLASLRFYDFPLPMHKNTWDASMAAACAADQGKFWEMHDRLFQGQDEWNGEATRNPKKVLLGYARALGLDATRWEQCFDSRQHLRQIEANKAEAERRRLQQTPTFIIGRRMVPGAIGYDQFRALVDSAARERTQGADTTKRPAAR
jgi:protein-disulfide isomerase